MLYGMCVYISVNYVTVTFRTISQKGLNLGSPNLLRTMILRYPGLRWIYVPKSQMSTSRGLKVYSACPSL